MTSPLAVEFERHGIDAGRIELRASRPHLDYLRFHNEIDLLLDTFPFSGRKRSPGTRKSMFRLQSDWRVIRSGFSIFASG